MPCTIGYGSMHHAVYTRSCEQATDSTDSVVSMLLTNNFAVFDNFGSTRTCSLLREQLEQAKREGRFGRGQLPLGGGEAWEANAGAVDTDRRSDMIAWCSPQVQSRGYECSACIDCCCAAAAAVSRRIPIQRCAECAVSMRVMSCVCIASLRVHCSTACVCCRTHHCLL
jgi:hypothetical protein